MNRQETKQEVTKVVSHVKWRKICQECPVPSMDSVDYV